MISIGLIGLNLFRLGLISLDLIIPAIIGIKLFRCVSMSINLKSGTVSLLA